jgi:hypothetical protein
VHLIRKDGISGIPAVVQTVADIIIVISYATVNRTRQAVQGIHHIPHRFAKALGQRVIVVAYIAAAYYTAYLGAAFKDISHRFYGLDR